MEVCQREVWFDASPGTSRTNSGGMRLYARLNPTPATQGQSAERELVALLGHSMNERF